MSWVAIPFYRQLAGIYKSLNIIVGDIGKEEKEKYGCANSQACC
jgi:hypothetical protein